MDDAYLLLNLSADRSHPRRWADISCRNVLHYTSKPRWVPLPKSADFWLDHDESLWSRHRRHTPSSNCGHPQETAELYKNRRERTYPIPNMAEPIIGTIQWILLYVVQPNQNSPIGTSTAPKMAGGSLYSGSLPPGSPPANSLFLTSLW